MDDGFSGVVRISNISDFIAPTSNCIIPLEENVVKLKPAEVIVRKKATEKESVKISLNDCLACNGCITSAETVLVQEQSLTRLLEGLANKSLSVVSVSPQSTCSIAVKRSISVSQAANLIASFFISKGVTYVVDTSFGRLLSLKFALEEFKNNKQRPILTSACPGFVCYAEKTHGKLLTPLISRIRSPQAIHGALVKDYLAKIHKLSASSVFHATVMPCFDKKLEASRKEFLIPGTTYRETDCVISTGELNDQLDSFCELCTEFPKGWLGDFGRGILIGDPSSSSSSGGYADYIIKDVLRDTNGELRSSQITKNLTVTEIGPPEAVSLRVAYVYGFRNIQNFVRKLKTGKCTYDYVEVMACPSGCVNGGGQIRAETTEERESMLKSAIELYHQINYDGGEEIQRVIHDWENLNHNWKSFVTTDYRIIESNIRQSLQW